jgi:hypothetical protein
MKNIRIETVSTASIHIKIGVVAFLKMFLRGVVDLSFMVKLYEVIAQTEIGQKAGVEMSNGDRVIAVRTSTHCAEIISAYNKYRGDEPIGGRVGALANALFKITLVGNQDLTARKISTVKRSAA